MRNAILGNNLKYKENNTKYRSLTWKPRSHVRILIYRTWPILKAKDKRALGTSLLIIPELRVLVLTKRQVGPGNEIGPASGDENNTYLICTRRAHYPANGTREISFLYGPYTLMGSCYIGICSSKVCVFLAVSVGNGISILAIVV